MDNYSLSDIRSALGNVDGFGTNSLWLIVLFFIIFSGGFRNGDGLGQYATAASQQEILFGQQFQNLDNKIDRVANGLADSTYALNNVITTAVGNATNAVTAEGRTLQAQIAQFNADQIARECELKTAIHAEGEATRAMIQQNKIESLQAQVNELKTQNMFCGIPRINPYGYQVVPNTGCGCNCGNI